jgi:capsular exopolysaccharide synthesis family protein
MSRLADALERAGAAGVRPSTTLRAGAPITIDVTSVPVAQPKVVAPAPPRPPEVTPEAPALVAPAPPALRGVEGSRSILAPESPAGLVRAPHLTQEGPETLRAAPALTGKLVGTPGLPAACIEQYRKLAATLHHMQIERGLKTLLVSSAVPGEGKTLTATNLGLTFSESYNRRVLIIDADLRRPTLHQMFDLPNLTGLGEGLRGDTERPLPLVQVSSRLTVLTAGRPDPDPMRALTSARMRRVIEEASAVFDWVIVDTPPVGLLPDGRLLTDMVEGALLVIRAGSTPFALITRAAEALGRDRIIGVVLNALDPKQQDAATYYAYGYGYYAPSGDEARRRNDRRRHD